MSKRRWWSGGAGWKVVVALAAALSCSCVRIPPPPSGVRVAPLVPPPPAIHPDGKPFRASADPDVMVWLLADELHTAMVFPYGWLLESGLIPPPGLGNPPYVCLSWGACTAFMQQENLNSWQVFRALFIPNPAVMEIIPVTGYVAEICQQQRVWRKLVPRERGPQVAAFLNHVSRTGANGRPRVIGPSSWGDGFLLDSQFSYYLPRICNVWTAQALEACGCRMFPLTALTPNGLIRQAEAPGNDFESVWRGDGTKLHD